MLLLPTCTTGMPPFLVSVHSVRGEMLSARAVSSAVSSSWGVTTWEALPVAHNDVVAMNVDHALFLSWGIDDERRDRPYLRRSSDANNVVCRDAAPAPAEQARRRLWFRHAAEKTAAAIIRVENR